MRPHALAGAAPIPARKAPEHLKARLESATDVIGVVAEHHLVFEMNFLEAGIGFSVLPIRTLGTAVPLT